MPAVINCAANLALGGSLAWVVKRSPAFHNELVSWPLLFLVAFEALVVTPVTTYLFRFYPQWSMLYWFDPQIFPGLDAWVGFLSLLAVLANAGGAVLGYYVTREGLLRGNQWMSYAPWIAGGLLASFTLLFYGDRVVFIGDYDTFWQGGADLLFTRVAGWVGFVTYAAAAGFVYWVHRTYRDRDPSLV